MVRQRLLGPVRLTLGAALLGSLLVATASVVAAAASLAITPGTGATPSPVGGNTYDLRFTTIYSSLDVDCGGGATPCSVWVTKNNGPKAGEALFTNATGSSKNILITFVNDGCVNFRLYDPSHTTLQAQLNIGHTFVCKADGSGQAVVLVNGSTGTQIVIPGGKGSPAPSTPLTVDFDSGFAGGVDEAELWIDRSLPSSPYGDCTTPAYPNSAEVLYTRNASGELTGLNPVGGGPYCFTLYQGRGHQTPGNAPTSLAIRNYLAYSGGTAVAGKDNAGGTIYYSSGNGDFDTLVCVYGPGFQAIPFDYNSQGYGNKQATFQTAGAGTYTYLLVAGPGDLDANGAPTVQSCRDGLGTLLTYFSVTT